MNTLLICFLLIALCLKLANASITSYSLSSQVPLYVERTGSTISSKDFDSVSNLIVPKPIKMDSLRTKMPGLYKCAEECSPDVSEHNDACKAACSLNAFCEFSCAHILVYMRSQKDMCAELCSYAAS